MSDQFFVLLEHEPGQGAVKEYSLRLSLNATDVLRYDLCLKPSCGPTGEDLLIRREAGSGLNCQARLYSQNKCIWFEALNPDLSIQSYTSGLGTFNGQIPLKASNPGQSFFFQLRPGESLFIGSKTITLQPEIQEELQVARHKLHVISPVVIPIDGHPEISALEEDLERPSKRLKVDHQLQGHNTIALASEDILSTSPIDTVADPEAENQNLASDPKEPLSPQQSSHSKETSSPQNGPASEETSPQKLSISEESNPSESAIRSTGSDVIEGHPCMEQNSLTILFATSSCIDRSNHFLRFLESKGVQRVFTVKECTHLCIGKSSDLKKTSKLIMAILGGKQVITDEWVVKSSKEQEILDPDSFTARNTRKEKEWNVDIDKAIERGRQQQRPFDGWTVYFTPTAKQETGKVAFAELKEIIQFAGGTICSARPKGEDTHTSTLVIAVPGDPLLSTLKSKWRCFSREIIGVSAMRGGIDVSADEFSLI